jgi:serine protease
LKKNISVELVVRQLQKTGHVLYAEPRYVYQPLYDPNDPDTANQYWIQNIQARAGWNISRGDTNVKIAIVDNGIQWNHPDLVDNVAYNWLDPINGLDDDGDGFVDNFHGWDLVG